MSSVSVLLPQKPILLQILRNSIMSNYKFAMSRHLIRISNTDNSQTDTRRFISSEVIASPPIKGLFTHLRSTYPIPCHDSLTIINRCFRTEVTKFRKVVPDADRDEEEGDSLPLTKGDKVLKVKLNTTRLDGILKAGLQISKNKIEKAFYEDRIRVNGERPKKKSQELYEGDEIDVVRGKNKMNEEFIDVSRVEVVRLHEDAVNQDEDEYASDDDEKSETKIPAVLKRYKSLTIENYTDIPWKGPAV